MAAVSILDHLKVAFRLAKRDASALDELENSPAALWFSFQAALIALPFFFITILTNSETPMSVMQTLAEVAMYAVGWLMFPVAMYEVAGAIDRRAEYCRYIVAVNWCSVIEDGSLALILVLKTVGILPEALGGIAFFAVVIWVFTFQFFVARNALRLDHGGAALVIGLRLMLGLALLFVSNIIGG